MAKSKKVTGLRPAIVLLSLSIWGSLMGIKGMIIALPLTVVLLAYYKRFILSEIKTEEIADTKRAENEKTNNTTNTEKNKASD